VGEHWITVERDAGTDTVLVQQDGRTVFRYRTAQQVEEPVKALSAWKDAWVLEVNGVLVVNGEIWNESKFKADEIFNWTMLNGKPFFFFRRGGSLGAWYDGNELPVTFAALIHDRCCEPAMFNVVNTEDQIRFYAEQNGMWYLNIFR
jgi:hypothetical protein